MNRIILFAVSFFAVSAAWAQPASTAAPSGSTETTTGDSVPIEEYVPKIIIEGKWGTGPGEFGAVSQFPLVASEKKYQPSSLAVDNKGNIYVLDTANNRIEKFNKDGKYLTSLVVESLKGEIAGYCVGKPGEGYCNEEPPEPGMKYDVPIMGAVEVEGINIVIDSKDTLFYYLKRVKDGKETGEVWEFKKDKLVRKMEVPADGGVYYEAPLGLSLEEDDSIWIFNAKENGKKTSKHYEIQGKKKYTTKERDEKLAKAPGIHKGQKNIKTTPLDRLRKLDLQITEEGVRIVRKHGGK